MAEKKNKKEASDTKEQSKQEKEPENPEFDIKIRVNKLFDEQSGKLRALASANISGFAVHGIRVMNGEKGLFVAMPSRSYKSADGTTQYEELFHPVTAEARTALYGAVIDGYHEAVIQAQSEEEELRFTQSM